MPIGKRVTQAHLDHFCPGGAGLPVTDSGPIGLGPAGDPPLGTGPNTARSASKSCARCQKPITPAQDARRRVTGGEYAGQRGFFTRDASGAVTGVDLAGRLATRV